MPRISFFACAARIAQRSILAIGKQTITGLNTDKTKYILFDSNRKKINNNKRQSIYFKKKSIEQVKNILLFRVTS